MKKLLLSLAAAAIAATAAAQPEAFAPSTLLYADLGLHTHSYGANTVGNVNRTLNWHSMLGVGYQFHPHWVVGINIGWSQDAFRLHKTASIDSSTTENNYQVGPFVRYTNSIMGSKTFYWFSQLNLSYQGGYTTSESLPSFGKHHGIGAEIIPAFGINLGKAWCLNFAIGGIGFHTDQYDAVGGVSFPADNFFDFTLGQNYSVGVSKNFGGHHHRPTARHEMGSDTRHMDADDDDDGGNDKKKAKRKNDDQ